MNAFALRAVLAGLLLACAAAGAAQQDVRRFYGFAYHLDGGRHAFTEVQEHRLEDGQWIGGATTYYLPDGSLMGRKTLDFRADPYVPVFRLELADGYAEGVSANGDPIAVFRGTRGNAASNPVAREGPGPIAADAGLPRLLRAHFPALQKGDTLRLRIVAPSRLAAYGFRARRVGDATFEGKPAIRIQLDLDSMLKIFSGPIFFSYEPGTLRLLEFSGLTNLRDPATGHAFDVRISYYSTPPADAPNLPPLSP
jgi:hypothetical protein